VEGALTKLTRSPLVQRMIDSIKKTGDYYEDVPKHWTQPEHGQEHALIAYIEQLEANQKARTVATTKKTSKRSKKPTVGKKKVTWTKGKGKLTWVCKQCFEDTALPAECQFGLPRGTDIRKDSGSSRKDKRYCGTCGEDHSVEQVRV
jgi:hypothetical protein